MSKVLDTLKQLPGQAARGFAQADSALPRSDAMPDFKGKGLLTALFDQSGSELKRRRGMEDNLKMTMVEPLLKRYWLGNLDEAERGAVSDEIKRILGGGRHTKEFLDKMFEVGGQVHGLNGAINPPPSQKDAALQESQTGIAEAINRDMAGGAETPQMSTAAPGTPTTQERANQPALYGPLPPPPAGGNAPAVLSPPPAPVTPQDQPLAQSMTVTATAPTPLRSALSKTNPPPPAQMGRAEELEALNQNRLAEIAATTKAQQELAGINNAAKATESDKAIGAGKYQKAAKVETKPETVDGVTKNVTRVYDPAGTLIATYQSENPAAAAPKAATPGSDRRKGFVLVDGKPMSVLIDKATNQVIPGSENPSELPPTAMLPRISEREVVYVDDDGNLKTVPLRSTRGVDLGHTSTNAGTPGASGGSTPNNAATPQVSAAPTTLGSRNLGTDINPIGSFNQSKQREIPVREAYTQLVGAPEFPNAPSLLQYASIADDPARREKLAKAVKLTFDGLRQGEKAHGSLINLLKLYSGVPEAMIAAETATSAQVIGDALKDDPELQDAYNSIMASFGTVVGLRSLTKASAAQFSIQRLENELPIPGLNSFNARDMKGKLGRLMLEVYNGAKNTPTFKPDELQYIKQWVDDLNKATATGLKPPPNAASAGAAGATSTAPKPGASTAPGAPSTSDTVRVISPSGQPGTIPRANLQRAIQQGYKEVR